MKKYIKKFSLLLSVLFLSVILLILYINFGSRLFDSGKERRTSDAYHALKFWTNARAYPEKDISVKNYFEAYQKLKSAEKNFWT